MTKTRLVAAIVAITALMAGCGGGGSGESAAAPQTPESRTCKPAKQLFSSQTAQNAGVYRGFMEASGHGINSEAYTLISPTGQILVLGGSSAFTGNFTDNYQASGDLDVWTDAGRVASYNLTGVFVAGQDVQGSPFATSEYRFFGEYQAAIEDLCLDSVDASGSWTQQSGAYAMTVTISPDKSINGSDTDGCVYAGRLGQGNIDGGVFSITTTVSNCPSSGQYRGVASLAGQGGIPGLIFGAIWSNSKIIPLALER